MRPTAIAIAVDRPGRGWAAGACRVNVWPRWSAQVPACGGGVPFEVVAAHHVEVFSHPACGGANAQSAMADERDQRRCR